MANLSRGCLGSILALFGIGRDAGGADGRGGESPLPLVRVNKYFITEAESAFFRVLVRVVGNRGHVLAQVSLKQLLWLPGSNKTNPGRASWQNRIDRKSVDFVVCDAATLAPHIAIELDEPTHARPDRQTRDEQVEEMLRAAGLPLVRVLASRTYDTRELLAALGPYFTPGA